MRLKLTALLLALLLLAGCASSVPVPQADIAQNLGLPRRVLVTQIQPDAAIYPQWQVVIQQQGAALRFLRFNLLGAPDVRQLLENGRWKNDGFIAPNAKARELFAALLFAFTDTADLPLSYQQACDTGNQRALNKNGQPHWTVVWQERRTQPEAFSIENHAEGIVWQVRPMR